MFASQKGELRGESYLNNAWVHLWATVQSDERTLQKRGNTAHDILKGGKNEENPSKIKQSAGREERKRGGAGLTRPRFGAARSRAMERKGEEAWPL